LASREPIDTQFSFPGLDDPASTEVGVILMGLGADRLLAGLGVAALAGVEHDPTATTLVTDQVRHGVHPTVSIESALAAGARRWVAARDRLAARPGGPTPVALRVAWTASLAAVDAMAAGGLGPASRSYLAACWLRRSELDGYLADHRTGEQDPTETLFSHPAAHVPPDESGRKGVIDLSC
jgi:hypothetical protein